MAKDRLIYFPLGDAALTVEFGDVISEQLNIKAINAAAAVALSRFPGLIETVPAYASATVFYDPSVVRRAFPEFETAFDAVRATVRSVIEDLPVEAAKQVDPIKIPVEFGDAAGPDLTAVANLKALSERDVISIFTSRTYRVFMIGFLPGFSYMGELDERIAAPRRETPRVNVARGSVGIAGRQTGIYSLESPGGWQIIGRTNLAMFTPAASEPSFLRPGDRVQFVEA